MVIEVTLNKHDFEENKAEKWRALSVLMGAETAETHLRISNPAESAAVPGTLEKTTPDVSSVSAPEASSAPVQPAGTAVPTTTPTYTLAQLQGVIGPLLSAGKGSELQSLLAKYGVAQMTDLRADQMDLFAADLRAMGRRYSGFMQ